MIKITHHSVIRFLQRVMKKSNYTQEDISLAHRYLEHETQDVVTHSYKDYFRLPTFHEHYAVVVENCLVTVLPKEYRVGCKKTN